eukprot:838839-Amphidinium_carterae.1
MASSRLENSLQERHCLKPSLWGHAEIVDCSSWRAGYFEGQVAWRKLPATCLDSKLKETQPVQKRRRPLAGELSAVIHLQRHDQTTRHNKSSNTYVLQGIA